MDKNRLRLKILTKIARDRPYSKLNRMAALLVTKDKEYHFGLNSKKTHPLAKKFSNNGKTICLHAEIDAIRNCIRAGSNPAGGSLYVARVLKDGTPALARPCSGCARAIVAFDIKECYWTE